MFTLFHVFRFTFVILVRPIKQSLNDTLPFLSKSIEKEHPKEEKSAKEIVNTVETLTITTIQM